MSHRAPDTGFVQPPEHINAAFVAWHTDAVRVYQVGGTAELPPPRVIGWCATTSPDHWMLIRLYCRLADDDPAAKPAPAPNPPPTPTTGRPVTHLPVGATRSRFSTTKK